MRSYFRVYILIVFFFVLFVPGAYTKNEKINDYQREVILGEFLPEDLTTPVEPLIEINRNTRNISFAHDFIQIDMLNSPYPNYLNFLEFSFFPELSSVGRCPNEILNNHVSYIRYIFRLLTISYLFETMKEFNSIGEDSCSLDWDQLFAKCKPHGNEMIKFLTRIKPVYVDAFRKKSFTSITGKELVRFKKNWCQNKNCSILERKEEVCTSSRKLIIKLCSERDEIYGLSYIPEAARIIKTSNVMNILDREGYGVGCIDRFVTLFKKSEAKYFWPGKTIPILFNKFVKARSRNLEGNLFLPGALREFDEKGLTEFLFALKPKPAKKKTRVVRPSIAKIMTPRPTPTTAPNITKKKEFAKVIVKKKIIPVVKKISEFEMKAKLRRERGLSIIILDMDKFAKDYVFDKKTISKYNKKLKIYHTRNALLDMKSFDDLGAKKEPLRLRYLKYLIDTDNHQGLFNIQAVIGEKFYLLNDFEDKKNPEYVKLENSEKTKYKWQIYILEAK